MEFAELTNIPYTCCTSALNSVAIATKYTTPALPQTALHVINSVQPAYVHTHTHLHTLLQCLPIPMRKLSGLMSR